MVRIIGQRDVHHGQVRIPQKSVSGIQRCSGRCQLTFHVQPGPTLRSRWLPLHHPYSVHSQAVLHGGHYRRAAYQGPILLNFLNAIDNKVYQSKQNI